MASLRIVQRPVYFAPTKGVHYLTKRAAAYAEASAMIARKYPTEQRERDEFGRETDPGWHWSLDDRLRRVHARLARRLRRAL